MESDATRVLATVVSGVLGLAIGSFLNVVVYRLPRGMSVSRPPSHCPSCQTELSALDNVPVLSWLALRGRCRHCGTSISARYPVIELVTGLAFAGLAWTLPSVEPIAPLCAVVAATVAIVAIDVDRQEVPAVLGWIGLACSASLLAVSLADHATGRLGWAAIGAGAGALAGLLHLALGRSDNEPIPFPAIAPCVAWGWAAGWIAQGGGLAVGIGLALLAVAAPLVGTATRRWVIAVAGGLAIATILAGAIAAR